MWFQITSRPLCGIGKGIDRLKSLSPLPPSARVVRVAFCFTASNTLAGKVTLRWVVYTGMR